MYFQLSTIKRNFIVLISTCNSLLSKFVSNFYLGGLGSYGRTVSHIFLKVVLFLSFIGFHGLPCLISLNCVYLFNLHKAK